MLSPNNSLRKTKIIATLGEKSSSKEVLVELIKAGMDVARISDIFLTMDKQQVLMNLKEAMKETGTQVGVMIGLRDSEIRIGVSCKTQLKLKKNDIVKIGTDSDQYMKICELWYNNKEFPFSVFPGDKLLVDYGKIILTVVSKNFYEDDSVWGNDKTQSVNFSVANDVSFRRTVSHESELHQNELKTSNFGNAKRPKRPQKIKSEKIVICRVENDCIFTIDKPVHICPINEGEIQESFVTFLDDIKLIRWAEENSVDFIVIKQVYDRDDLDAFLNVVQSKTAKIWLGVQNKGSCQMFEEFAEEIDGTVLGRGTLALETSLAEVCRIQKNIVHRSNELGKPVVISTQLLESMIIKNVPTNSEVNDITNAVLDGADALLLCGETAYGVDPINTLQTCARICVEAEKHLDYRKKCEKIKNYLGNNISITENTCYSAFITVSSTNCKAIACITRTGKTAQILSRFFPPCAIVAITNSESTCRQLKIVRGVYPFYVTEKNEAGIVERVLKIMHENFFCSKGDNFVLVSGPSHDFNDDFDCSLWILTLKSYN